MNDPTTNDDEEAPGAGPEAAEGEYEVGFGKPPKEHRFKKGNRLGKGRPRGSRNLKTVVRATFEAEDAVMVNGKRRNLNTVELAMLQLKKQSASGNLKATDKIIELYARYGPVEDDDVPISDKEFAYDLATLRHYLMMREVAEDGEAP